MKIYLAGQDVEAASTLAERMKLQGHEVVSTWHSPANGSPRRDITQIDGCDLVVAILTKDGMTQFLELGYATGRGKKAVIILRGGKLSHPAMASRFPVFEQLEEFETWLSRPSAS